MDHGRDPAGRIMTDKSSRRIAYHGRIQHTIILDAEVSHKLLHVLRLGPGDEVTLVDEAGETHRFVIERRRDDLVEIRWTGAAKKLAANFRLIVAPAVIKGQRMDWMIEKLAEIGVEEILPWHSERSIPAESSPGKVDRWRRIAAAARLQSAHAKETTVADPAGSFDDVLTRSDVRFFMDQTAIADPEKMDRLLRSSSIDSMPLLFVGPEGGWSDAERERLHNLATGFSVGEATLRSETAAIIGAFYLMQYFSK